MLGLFTFLSAYALIGLLFYVIFRVKSNLTDTYVDSGPDKFDYKALSIVFLVGWPVCLPVYLLGHWGLWVWDMLMLFAKKMGNPVEKTIIALTAYVENKRELKQKLLEEQRERAESKPVSDSFDYRTVERVQKYSGAKGRFFTSVR